MNTQGKEGTSRGVGLHCAIGSLVNCFEMRFTALPVLGGGGGVTRGFTMVVLSQVEACEQGHTSLHVCTVQTV